MPADDTAIDARLRAGDQQAVGELLEANRERLLRTIRLRLDPRLAQRMCAEDVLQEAWLAATQRLPHYAANATGHPYTWLRLVVVQTLVDCHRHHLGVQQRDPRREMSLVGNQGADDSAVSAATVVLQLSGAVSSPSAALRQDELRGLVAQALAQVSDSDREVIVLRHFEDLGNDEVAEALGIAEKAASIRYVRAITRLRDALEALGLSLGDLRGR